MISRRHAPRSRAALRVHLQAGLGDIMDEYVIDPVVEQLTGYADELGQRVYDRLVEKLPQLTEDARPHVRKLVDEAVAAASASPAAQEARAELKSAFTTSTLIGVGASFAAAFLAEWWGRGSRR